MSAVQKMKKKEKKEKKAQAKKDEVTPILSPPDEFAGEPEKSLSSVISVKEAAEPDKSDNINEIQDHAVPGTSGSSRPTSASQRPGSRESRTVSPHPPGPDGLDIPDTTASEPATGSRPQSAASRSPSSAAMETPQVSSLSPPGLDIPPERSISPVAKETSADGSRPCSGTSHRSHRKNAVQPFSEEGPSTRMKRPSSSMSKTKQAWGTPTHKPTAKTGPEPEQGPAPNPRPKSANPLHSLIRPSSGTKKTAVQSLVSLKEQVEADNARISEDVLSVSPSTRGQQLGPSEMNETHAYVPYIYARDCIAKIMADMKRMKNGHIRIVCDIESTYKNIEDDTQTQFNTFVYSLRDQYGKKVKTFRQVVEVHRLELQQKQNYWDEALTSLSERNKKLLQDKKALLIKNKIEADQMEQEKGSATSQLVVQLDEMANEKKKLETELDSKEKDISNREEEKKRLDEENRRLQLVLDELQSRPESARLVAAAMVAVDAEEPVGPQPQADVHAAPMAESPVIEKQTVEETKTAAKLKASDESTPEVEPVAVPVPTVVVQDLSQAERDAMEAERQTIKEERLEIQSERVQIQTEREHFGQERKKFQEDRVIWQGDLNSANKDGETWKAKYQGLKDQLGELADLRAKYQAIQLQFTALAAMATVTTEEDKQKADEKIKKAEQDKDIMEEERHSMDLEIAKWEEDFKQKNNREPKESDKPESVKEMETSRDEAQNMISGLDAQIDTLQTLKQGDVPTAPEVAPQPINVSEPEVKIVEVYVPDPETAAQLEQAQAEISQLQTQLDNVRKQFNDVRNDNTNLQGEVADSVWDLKKSKTINKEQEKKLLQQAREIQKLSKGVRPSTVGSGRPLTAGGEGLAVAELERQLRDKEQEMKDLELKHKEQLKTQEIAAEKKQKSTENDIKKLLKEMAKLKKKIETKKESEPEISETELEKAEDKAYSLEDKILDMETKLTNLNSDKELLNNINKDLRQRLKDYGHDLNASEDKVVTLGAAVTVSAADPTPEEIDDLQAKVRQVEEKIIESEKSLDEKVREHARDLEDRDKQKKEMEKDMKKLLKHIAKLREQLKEAKGEAKEEESVQKSADLDTAVSDLQTDNEHLKESNKTLESRVSGLEQELSDMAERIHELELKADLDIDLQNAKDQIQDLREKIRALEGDVRTKEEDLRQKVRDLREKEHQAKEQEREHEKEIREKVKVENEMQKDMKKMLKEIAKLRRKLAAAGGDTKEDVNDETEKLEKDIEKLEDKVTKLENQLTDVEGEKTDADSKKQELEERVAELESELEEARDQATVAPSGDYGMSSVALTASSEDIEELNRQINVLQKQVDITEREVREEKSSHGQTREELESLQDQIKDLNSKLEDKETEAAAKLDSETSKLNSEINSLKQKLSSSLERVVELDKARLANVPVDTAKEISQLQAKLDASDKEKDVLRREIAEGDGESKELKAKIKSLEKASVGQKTAGSHAEAKFKLMKSEKEKEIKQLQGQMDKKERERQLQEQKKLNALQKKINELEAQAASGVGVVSAAKGGKPAKGADPKAHQQLQDKLREAKQETAELRTRVKQLEKLGGGGGGGGASDFETQKQLKKQEKLLKELEKVVDNEKKKNKKNQDNLAKQEQELNDNKKEIRQKDEEITRLKAEMTKIGASAAEAAEMAAQIKKLESHTKSQEKEIKTLSENFNSERVLRKKYYNMVEDMKGKIRVYCRVRPMSKSELNRGNNSVIKSPDEYSCIVDTSRGVKDFQFDTVFMPDSSQEKVFEDTNNLVQSAVDGYNVCIFAYGQTGSGKTFTIIGDREGNYPGIAPRAFERIYELLEENKSKFSYKVNVYMMELYNDRLIDLFSKPGTSNEEKMDIKKDKKGMVVVAGAEVKSARNSKELYALFEEGSKSRHTSSTMMNAESSRSHLVIGIVIETTNKTTGSVVKGKLSLVDLAGSERAAKTQASAEQLKEAMSINKSLSALGDVISALSSEQQFIPYRNNKLTMLMQDSLGGNAKTLMFVNISPADYNADETVVSLTYASRVKLITNDAQKNSDNKEIARLKNLIAKMKKGETVEEEVEDD